MSNRTKPSTCPTCMTTLDAVTGMTDPDAMPEPGDVTVCFYCTTVLEYAEDMTLQIVDIKTLEPEVRDVIAMAMVHMQSARDPRKMH